MFTGLIQALAPVLQVEPDAGGGRTLTVARPAELDRVAVGDSIAVNGCCLTVTTLFADALQFKAGPETLAKTNLGLLQVGESVNLEQALRVGDRLGGHFVTGHVDGVGQVAKKEQQGEWLMIEFACPPAFNELMVNKGSVAVDGVSLTVVTAVPGTFRVMLIPHTRDHTTLGLKDIGAAVNLELDLLAKHVQKLIANLNVTI